MWYESKVFAVVVGAILGFLLSYVPTRVEQYKRRKALERALLIEIERIVIYMKGRRGTYLGYREMIARGGRLGIYTTDRSLDIVYRANVGSIALVSENMVAEIVGFYAGVNEFLGRIRALSESLRDVHDGSDPMPDQNFFFGSLDRIVSVIDRTIKSGDRLLQIKGHD